MCHWCHLASPRNHSHAELKVGTDLDQRSFGASRHEGIDGTTIYKNDKPRKLTMKFLQKQTNITNIHRNLQKSVCHQGCDHNGKATAATTDAHEACPTTWRLFFYMGRFRGSENGQTNVAIWPNKVWENYRTAILQIFQKRSCKAYQKLRSLHLRSRA